MAELERLQKYLARCGVASRRGAEEMIRRGEVAVNGDVVTVMGLRIDPSADLVTVNGEDVSPPARCVYYAYWKPRGLVVSRNDELGRETIFDHLPDTTHRLLAVGRLDRESEGLLLLTDDGEWANRVSHPSSRIEKEYEVRVSGSVSTQLLRQMMEGVELERGITLRADTAEKLVSKNKQTLLRLVLHEGRKRHIRRMLEALEMKVLDLLRVRVGSVDLGRLKPGKLRKLTEREIAALSPASQSQKQ